jgi:hypothetical protein
MIAERLIGALTRDYREGADFYITLLMPDPTLAGVLDP